ncbi:hypothetical protein U1Q18_020861, partial [Sarracenia purpurea var. burkii]
MATTGLERETEESAKQSQGLVEAKSPVLGGETEYPKIAERVDGQQQEAFGLVGFSDGFAWSQAVACAPPSFFLVSSQGYLLVLVFPLFVPTDVVQVSCTGPSLLWALSAVLGSLFLVLLAFLVGSEEGRESNIGETIGETVVDCPEGDKAILDFPSLPRRLNISGENGTVSERASLIPNQVSSDMESVDFVSSSSEGRIAMIIERESESPDSSHSEVEESSSSAAEAGAS